VTVLFADVVHSMDIARLLGAERWREIMAQLATCASSVVQRYDGTVGSFTGDGIMAVFGAPTALEDHAIGHAWPRWPSKTRPSGSTSRWKLGTASS
jgi:class 3 adenylate cyclase